MVSATGNRHSREKANHLFLKQQNQFKVKTKIKILIVSFVIAAAAVTGFNLAQENSNMDVSLADIAVMARATDGENPGYPVGQYCGQNTCSKECGVPPYVYTANGHYWVCKWKDTPGDCDSELCEKECDAKCFG